MFEIFSTEERNGDYQCAGSIIVYTHPETDKEDLIIKGPITEDIQLQVISLFIGLVISFLLTDFYSCSTHFLLMRIREFITNTSSKLEARHIPQNICGISSTGQSAARNAQVEQW